MTTLDTEPVLAEAALRSALSTRERPPAASGIGASVTFAWRAMLKIKHVPMQLFDVTAFPIMFVLLYTYLFGGALAGSPREYLQRLLPGILVMTVSWITMYTGMNLNTDISKGVFDRFRSLPVWRPAVLVGMLTFASDVFVGTETMPGWVQAFVRVNPITFLARASRSLMHGPVDEAAIFWVLVWSAGCLLVFAPMAVRLYRAER